VSPLLTLILAEADAGPVSERLAVNSRCFQVPVCLQYKLNGVPDHCIAVIRILARELPNDIRFVELCVGSE
jgi:hypothetical protein